MCLNPVQIDVHPRGGSIGASVKRYWKDGVLQRDCVGNNTLSHMGSRTVLVPCGKCTECLKRRQLDLSVRAMREAEKRGSMVFCTLTYENRYLPLQVTLRKCDKESGEIYDEHKGQLFRYSGYKVTPENADFIDSVKRELFAIRPGCRPVVITRPFLESDEWSYWYEITPSLNRRDVRLWLKRCRVRYVRDTGKELPEFSYLLCGEYGPNTCRPHYHLCFFGLSKEQVDYFCSLWDYGFTNVKSVFARNPDGTSGFQIASLYVGKYVTKGKFECDSVKCGISEKPRSCLSIHFGTELSAPLVSYFRCYDLFGEYDIDSLEKSDGKRLSSAEMTALIHEVKKRSFIECDGKRFPIPRSIVLRLWYVYEKNTKLLRCSKFRTHYSFVVSGNSLADTHGKPVALDPEVVWREDIESSSEFLVSSEDNILLQEAFNEASYRAFYNSSIF